MDTPNTHKQYIIHTCHNTLCKKKKETHKGILGILKHVF